MSGYPFSAVVGQDDLKLALLLNAVDPLVGGVLVRGQKGTAKSTTVRGLAALLPDLAVVAGDPYNRGPDEASDDPRVPPLPTDMTTVARPTPLVELPVGASEDRLVGALDLERALVEGVRAFEPGLLAAAHRGVLYVDEVNLLSDHLVDLLLDAAAAGTAHVEREGVSVRHPSRFLLVGTMNPEEGELRPQLLDRFGLAVTVAAPTTTGPRAEVVRRRLAFDADPAGFAARWTDADAALAARVVAARQRLDAVALPDDRLHRIAHVCARFEVDGLRADVVISRAARAHAAWCGRDTVTLDDVRVAALLALPHRRRRGPLEEPGIDADELEQVLHEPLDPDDDPPPDGNDGRDDRDEGGVDERDDDGGHDPDTASRRPEDDATPDARPDHSPTHTGDSATGDSPTGGGNDDGLNDDGGADGADETTGEDGPGTVPHEGSVAAVGAAGPAPRLEVAGSGQGARGRRSASSGDHGAVVGARPRRAGEPAADLSPGATLRAAAPHQAARGRSGAGLVVRPEDLRRRVRQGREGNLVVFVVDASGSMGARHRMQAVKGTIRSLLLDAYQRRDRLALVTFRGRDAEVVLPPTSSVEVADRRLVGLPTGGRTPLAAGLWRAAEVLAREARHDPDRRPLLVVLTDGRANVGGDDPRAAAHEAAAAIAGRGTTSVVVDTEDGFVRLGLAADLAEHLGASLLQLDDVGADALTQVVRRAARHRRAA